MPALNFTRCVPYQSDGIKMRRAEQMKHHGREEEIEVTFTELESRTSQRPQRREHPRRVLELDVSIGNDSKFYAGFIENLSVGGVFIATHALKQIGETLALTIHLPDAETPITGTGEVRWIRDYSEQSNIPPGMGIRFIQIEPASQPAIERLLNQRELRFFDDD
jgi:uncharacterized protein (TIGR02266 family)